MAYKLNKKIDAIRAISPDAKDEKNRIIDFKHATQEQMAFLYKQKHPAIIKTN